MAVVAVVAVVVWRERERALENTERMKESK